jgi:crotonobetainyl-CoA:carnitine CoA-transferase CaiB-like acyl-CoA transferase
VPDDVLSGVRVLELASGIAASYCGRLLSDLGAEVVKLARVPDEDRRDGPPLPARNGMQLYLDRAKEVLPADLGSQAGRQGFRDLLADADVLVEDLPPGRLRQLGLGPDILRAAAPRLLVASVTPFGQDGPRSGWKGDEFTSFHGSGWAYNFPSHIVPSLDHQPLNAPSRAAGFLAGEVVATAVLAGLLSVQRSGVGAHLDLSLQEALAADNQSSYNVSAVERGSASRTVSDTPGTAVASLLPCRDGWVAVSARENRQWERWTALIGGSWAGDPRLTSRKDREREWEWVYPLMAERTRPYLKADLVRLAQEAGVPCLPFGTAAELLKSPQFTARGFFIDCELPGGSSMRIPGPPYRWTAGAAPAVLPERLASGEAHDPGRPLAGVRVVDFSWVLSGPICTKYLAALGADVIKIETRTRPDLSMRNPAWEAANLGKRSFTVDLKTEEGRDLVRQLVAKSDIVVENFSTGVMERLGFGYPELKALNPGIIVASSSSFGRTGPDASQVAYGTLIQCFTGWAELSSYPGEVPRSPGGVWADPLLGVLETTLVLAALWHRERTGAGCYVDVSLAEATLAAMPEAILAWELERRLLEPRGNRDPVHAPQGCYPTSAPDSWVALTVHDDEQWRALTGLMDLTELAGLDALRTAGGRAAEHDRIDKAIVAWTSRRTPAEVVESLQRAGVAAAPTVRQNELREDEHLRARRFFTEVPALSGQPRQVPALAWLLDGRRLVPAGQPPELGSANDYVLSEVLGLPPEACADLVDRKVIY